MIPSRRPGAIPSSPDRSTSKKSTTRIVVIFRGWNLVTRVNYLLLSRLLSLFVPARLFPRSGKIYPRLADKLLRVRSGRSTTARRGRAVAIEIGIGNLEQLGPSGGQV